MTLYDQHVHSHHSMDSRAAPAASVEAALARGLAGVTFTEHFDTHPDDWPDCVYDDEAYSASIARLRGRFGDAIFVGKGVEVCYQPARMDFILDFLKRHEFDVVLLSVHYFGSRALGVRDNWAGVTAEEGTRRYLSTVLEGVRFCRRLHRRERPVFDVLAHLDLVKRYTKRFLGTGDVTSCVDLLDEILMNCLEADLVPEINTSSLRQDLEETMPGDETVDRFARLGGTAMPLGSDAHRPEEVGASFDRAVGMLRAAGMRHTVVFRERQRVEVPLA